MLKSSKKRKPKGILVCTIADVAVILSASALCVTYFLTGYIPLLLMSLMFGMPALINLILLIPIREPNPLPVLVTADEGEQKPKFFARVKAAFKKLSHLLKRLWCSIRNVSEYIIIALCSVVAVAANYIFWKKAMDYGEHTLNFVLLLGVAVIFVLFIILDKWCKHTVLSVDSIGTRENALIGNLRGVFLWGKIVLIIAFAVMACCTLGFFDVQKYFVFVLCIIFAYQTLFTVMSFAIRVIKRELGTLPDIAVPMIGKGSNNLNLIEYLEENTGITMRSLWSIRLIKKTVPVAVLGTVCLLWLSTAVVQIEPYQQGALYRLGVLKDDSLKPGFHITLPWPFDKVSVYDTENVNELTVGYLSTEATDNLWTEAHGNNEYKLLLGGGDELVSINLRVEYRISNLGDYLRCSATPELLLESAAYEAVTNRTVSTDLNTLLATDRAEFSKSFETELRERISKYQTGLEVVSVVIESIHPPVEVAQIYQEMISAEINAQQLILNAEAAAGVMISDAQIENDTKVYYATSQNHEKIAEANSSVAEFMASVEADDQYGSSYRYQKYIDALKEAYSGANLIIVGDGIDSSALYIGSVS